jgi:hypothetical protein
MTIIKIANRTNSYNSIPYNPLHVYSVCGVGGINSYTWCIVFLLVCGLVFRFKLKFFSRWYDVGVLMLKDPGREINLHTFTQLTPVPAAVVALAQEDTPNDYPLRWSGLAVTIGSLMANNLEVSNIVVYCKLERIQEETASLMRGAFAAL